MEKIVMVLFDDERNCFKAFKDLQNDYENAAYTIEQMSVVKKQDGIVSEVETFDPKTQGDHFTEYGGIIGGLVGVLGGPLGVFLGATVGLLAGGAVEQTEGDDELTLVEYVSTTLDDGSFALVTLVDEDKDDALNDAITQGDAIVRRWDASVIAAEVDHAEDVQEQLAKEARKQLRERRKQG